MRELKRSISLAEKQAKSADIFSQIERLEQFKTAKIVLLYWSMTDEVYTHQFIEKWYNKKTILLPSVNGNFLDLKIYTGPDSMKKGEQFAIEEPIGENFTDIEKINLAIIPGVAFDKQYYRLGRGRGYYDRFLSEYVGFKMGICFDIQVVPEVPTEDHDISLDKIIYA